MKSVFETLEQSRVGLHQAYVLLQTQVSYLLVVCFLFACYLFFIAFYLFFYVTLHSYRSLSYQHILLTHSLITHLLTTQPLSAHSLTVHPLMSPHPPSDPSHTTSTYDRISMTNW